MEESNTNTSQPIENARPYKTNWVCSCGIVHDRKEKCPNCGEVSAYQVTRLGPKRKPPTQDIGLAY